MLIWLNLGAGMIIFQAKGTIVLIVKQKSFRFSRLVAQNWDTLRNRLEFSQLGNTISFY